MGIMDISGGGGSGHGGGAGGNGVGSSGGSGPGAGGQGNAGGLGAMSTLDGLGAPASLWGAAGGLDLSNVRAPGGMNSAGGDADFGNFAGGGGGGGADASMCAGGAVASAAGYAGGAGGAVGMSSGGGGGGGGGAGVVIRSNGARCTIGVATGGRGGDSGTAGGGGGGGSGLYVIGNANVITIASASGGDGGDSVGVPGGGFGGVGGDGIRVEGSGNTVTVTSTVTAGQGGTPLAAGSAGNGSSIQLKGANNTLVLQGAAIAADIRLTTAGSRFKGTASINGALVLNGTLAPGHSIGTVSAAFLDMRAGIYEAEINAGTGAADLIQVTGPGAAPSNKAAWVDGAALNVSNLGGTLSAGQSYTLLDAGAGGVDGLFTLGALPAGATGHLVQDGTTVVLQITAFVAPPSPSAAASVPVLSPWGLALLSIAVAGGAFRLRRREGTGVNT